MDKCPTELHSYIVELASTTDTGFTYCSLSLVNSYISSIARPCRFHSLSIDVSSPPPITRLLAVLEATPERMRRVRHLLLSAPSTPIPKYSKEDAQLTRSIMRLLQLTSPTLQTLTFQPPLHLSTSSISYIFSPHLTFPCLTSLSLHGYYPFPSSSCNMPRLRKLSLEGNRNPSGLFQLSSLRTAFPELTHLHIGSLSASNSFASELEDIFGFGFEHNMVSLSSASLLPPKLEFLVIQPGKEIDDRSGTGRIRSKDELMMQRLHTLESIVDLAMKEGKGGAVRFRVLERSMGPEYERHIGKFRWVDGVC